MKEEVSKEILEKAYLLLRQGKVKKEIETDKRIHFSVEGETEIHSVIFDKEKNEWDCDCKWSSLRKQHCSHIVSAKLLIQ
jgi:hypothetical protein